MTEKKKEKKFTRRLLHKYRLVVLNEETFEERFAIKLTRLNVFVIFMLTSIFLIAATTYIIAFTSLKEFIPGYSSAQLKKQAIELNYKTDSLQQVISLNEKYFASIRRVLTGDVKTVEFNRDSVIEDAGKDIAQLKLAASKEDSLLREKVAKEDKYNLFDSSNTTANYLLFPPVNGTISEGYDAKNKHFAVDIIVAKGTPVKATANGTVIFAEWTSETGYVVIIEHNQELISVYKHNASLTKQQGDLVKAGEVIAIVGNTGEYTTGPHLHFELWSKGYPINPTNFIDFK